MISLKLGINLVNQDLLRRRALGPAVHGWLDTIRDGHPTTPIRLVSSVFCGIHKSVPGPTGPDMQALAEGRVAFVATGDPEAVARGALTLEVVREVLAEVVERRDDPHLWYVDGLALYGPADAERLPLPDNLHRTPPPPAHRRAVRGARGLVAGATAAPRRAAAVGVVGAAEADVAEEDSAVLEERAATR